MLLKLIADRDWSHPDVERYLDSSLLESQARKGAARSRQAYFDQNILAGKASEVEIMSVSTEVKEEEGRASVWMLVGLSNDPHDHVRESITVMQWRIDGGRWKCYEQTALRDGSGFGV